jgi:DNA polymerase-3 subunit delta
METFAARLREQLLPVYLVSGDEPLLVGEATDAIRARARAEGYGERETFFMERGSNWDDVRQAAQALSLFSSRRIVEIRLPTGRPGAGAGALLQLINAADADLMVLILTQRLDREVADARNGCSAVQTRGGVAGGVARECARSLRSGCAPAPARVQGSISAEDALQLAMVAARTEGNLLAAQPGGREALRCCSGPGPAVPAWPMIAASSGESARFNRLPARPMPCSAMDAARALRVLAGLRAEGAEALYWYYVVARSGNCARSPAPHAAQRRSPAYGQPSRSACRAGSACGPHGCHIARLTMRAARVRTAMAKGMAARRCVG